MWRAGYRHVRIGTWIIIGRAADTAWIQNQGMVRQLNEVLEMAMPAQDHTRDGPRVRA